MSQADQPVAKEDGESAASFQSSVAEASSAASTAADLVVPAGGMAHKGDAEGAEEAMMEELAPQAEHPEAADEDEAPRQPGREDEAEDAFESGAEEAAGDGAEGQAAATGQPGRQDAEPMDSQAALPVALPAAFVLEKTAPTVRAVLEGTASCDDGKWRLAGRWRLRWADNLTSEFEWRSVASGRVGEPPCTGAYEGYFFMYLPQGQMRYEETELVLKFAENAEGGFNVEGDGRNDFGLFGIRGTVNANRGFRILKVASGPPWMAAGTLDRSQPWMTVALELVRYTACVKQAKWFRHPVPGTCCVNRGQEVVWYHEVVKSPMDFQTVRDNIKANKYDSIDEFATDARLIFTNAWTFNRPGDACYEDADMVYLRFERRLAQLFNSDLPDSVEEVEIRVCQREQELAESRKRRRKEPRCRVQASSPRRTGGRAVAPRTAANRGTRELSDEAESPNFIEAKLGRTKSLGGEDLEEELNETRKQMEQLQEQLRELKSPRGRGAGRGAGRGPRRREKVGLDGGRGGGRKGGQSGCRSGARNAKCGSGASRQPQVPRAGTKLMKAEVVDSSVIQPLTENEKEVLQQRIDLLDEERLEEVIDFLSTDLSAAGEGEDDEKEVQLDVELLAPAKQRALVDFVEAQLRKVSPAASQLA